MTRAPGHPPAQSPSGQTALGQAFAAIVAILIAALAEHARQSPNLAGLMALAIRRLEAMSGNFDAMVATWQADHPTPRRTRARTRVASPRRCARMPAHQRPKTVLRARGRIPAHPHVPRVRAPPRAHA
jgi:hypothetical protein